MDQFRAKRNTHNNKEIRMEGGMIKRGHLRMEIRRISNAEFFFFKMADLVIAQLSTSKATHSNRSRSRTLPKSIGWLEKVRLVHYQISRDTLPASSERVRVSTSRHCMKQFSTCRMRSVEPAEMLPAEERLVSLSLRDSQSLNRQRSARKHCLTFKLKLF